RQAVALDSTYAPAWAGLGKTYLRLAAAVPTPDRERYYALAEQAAWKAVALDDSLAEGHATLGAIRMRFFDAAGAERHLKRAVELHPTRALTYEWMVTLYLWTGRPAEALAHADRALELDPLSPIAHAQRAHALLYNHRCTEALAHLEKLAGLDPPLLRAALLQARCYARKQMWPEARAVLRPQAARGEPHALALLGYMLARAGQRDEALRIQATLIEQWRHGNGNPYQVAVVYTGLRDFDKAFALLERATAEHALSGVPGRTLNHILLGPLLEDLQHDPRFARLRARIGLQMR
ncbi:MAG: hypothetical protein KY466_16775, partial [Gemmatimonadetes bacterium]|nr:hypothetical protein [Gemmatimonadota bacterium]